MAPLQPLLQLLEQKEVLCSSDQFHQKKKPQQVRGAALPLLMEDPKVTVQTPTERGEVFCAQMETHFPFTQQTATLRNRSAKRGQKNQSLPPSHVPNTGK